MVAAEICGLAALTCLFSFYDVKVDIPNNCICMDLRDGHIQGPQPTRYPPRSMRPCHGSSKLLYRSQATSGHATLAGAA